VHTNRTSMRYLHSCRNLSKGEVQVILGASHLIFKVSAVLARKAYELSRFLIAHRGLNLDSSHDCRSTPKIAVGALQ
jgi:hypothetical protein